VWSDAGQDACEELPSLTLAAQPAWGAGPGGLVLKSTQEADPRRPSGRRKTLPTRVVRIQILVVCS